MAYGRWWLNLAAARGDCPASISPLLVGTRRNGRAPVNLFDRAVRYLEHAAWLDRAADLIDGAIRAALGRSA
jgi:hypothetical protein